MNKKLSTGISLYLFLFCIPVFAEQFQVNTVYTDQPNEVSFVVTLPPGLETPPKPSDFKLLDGSTVIKSADEIKPFAASNRKSVLLFCVDVSRSISGTTLKETQDALINFVSGDLPKDKYLFGLVSFADSVTSSPYFTDKSENLIKSIRELKIASRGNKTLLNQAAMDSLYKLDQLKPTEYRRILIISDGKDEGSIETYDSVINLSNRLGIPIDGIAINGKKPQYDVPQGLSGLAKATGGRFINPRDQSMSLKEAVIWSHNRFIENTLVVHFRYQQSTEKPKLENIFIKFKPNDTLNLNADFSRGVPAPKNILISEKINETPPANNEYNWIQEALNKPSAYWLLGLLVLTTLIFIVWSFQRSKKSSANSNDELSTDHNQMKTGAPNQNLFTTKIQYPEEKSNQRQTMISSVKHQEIPSIAIEVIEGPLEGQKTQMVKPTFRIGANQDNDLILIDDYVSRNHASLTYDNSELILSDLDSRNGTFLNDVLMNNKTSVVLPGDVIRIGNTSLRIIAT